MYTFDSLMKRRGKGQTDADWKRAVAHKRKIAKLARIARRKNRS